MEKFEEAHQKAKKNLQVADHFISVTYKIVHDPKLLMAALNNIFLSLAAAMSAVLHYEQMYKRIPPFSDTFDAKFLAFKQKCMKRYNLGPEYTKLIQEVRDFVRAHKKSPVEFVRKDHYIICSDGYDMKTITPEGVKKYIEKTKQLLTDIEKILMQNDRVLTGSV